MTSDNTRWSRAKTNKSGWRYTCRECEKTVWGKP